MSFRFIQRQNFAVLNTVRLCSSASPLMANGNGHELRKLGFDSVSSPASYLLNSVRRIVSSSSMHGRIFTATSSSRGFATTGDSVQPFDSASDAPPRIKFKRLDKTAKHIMQILDKEAVGEVRAQREIPDIKPGYIVQLKVEVPENKRRASIVKGIVIARRNAGLNSTFRIRRLVAGVGVESMFPLYSPNLKEIKVLDKKKVRRAKLYYLRDKMNALKKH
ncbi:PREDICTED: 50S ribosomal protein L19, chloroplastic-like isoform X2 [Tarenaya hassleriana]|uniref:50S ribosomal protein L19, chloroplastic-like isoform X2 n=1 Tax=Tarenaya hassleriana TaxID=28532 RepID=UPI00053C8634|nr:PREDICTED: 50S ribosomal protein L19, chloroplastic-like isoform X2 [Tarenaya hassleriana]